MQTIIDTYRDIVVQIATPYSLGTGFYLSEHDLIVTNEHVIRGNEQVVLNGMPLKSIFLKYYLLMNI